MKKTGRLLALLLALTLVFAFAAGCNTTTPEPSASPSDSPSASPSASPSDTGAPPDEPEAGMLPIVDEMTTLSIFGFDRPFLWDVMENYDENFVQMELSRRTNILCDFYWFSGSEQLSVNIASQELFDIYWNLWSFYPGGWSRAYEEGVIMDLTDLVRTEMPNYYSMIKTDPLAMKCVTDSDGRMLHIAQLTTEVSPVNAGLLMREDYLDKLDIDPASILTYDDYYNALTRMKTELGVKSPLYMFNNGTTCNNVISAGYGVSSKISAISTSEIPWYKVNGEIRFGGVQDEFLEYLTMLREWYEAGVYDSDFMSHNDQRFLDNEGIWSGVYGCVPYHWEIIDELTLNGKNFDPDYKLTAVANPVKTEGDINLLSNNYAWTTWTNFDIVISTQCEIPEIACRWMDYSYSDEGILLGNYGVEGESFEYVNGQPQFIESFLTDNYLVGDRGIQMVKNACLGTNSAFARIVTAYDMFSSDSAVNAKKIWAQQTELSDFNKSYDVLTAISIPTDISPQYSSIMNEVTSYLNEWIPQYIMGQKNASEWPTVVANIETLNLQQATDWMQAAYDDFMSRS